MTDGALPTPADAGGPVSAVAAWKTHLAAAIGAFFLGLTDFIRHGTDSTTMLLNGLLTSRESEFSLTPAILLLIPFLGVTASWIFKPSTEREAFALGFAVFSVFALAPEEGPKSETRSIQISSTRIETGWVLIGNAYAAEVAAEPGTATVILRYEGAPPKGTEVTVSNLTERQRLGSYLVQDSLRLTGKPGDRVLLAMEAPGYERTTVELTLQEVGETYTVDLEKSSTPLFIQRLTRAHRALAIPRNEQAIGPAP